MKYTVLAFWCLTLYAGLPKWPKMAATEICHVYEYVENAKMAHFKKQKPIGPFWQHCVRINGMGHLVLRFWNGPFLAFSASTWQNRCKNAKMAHFGYVLTENAKMAHFKKEIGPFWQPHVRIKLQKGRSLNLSTCMSTCTCTYTV